MNFITSVGLKGRASLEEEPRALLGQEKAYNTLCGQVLLAKIH